MPYYFPELTGYTGTIDTGTNVVDLDGTTLRSLRSFDEAVDDGGLVDEGVTFVKVWESASKWAIWKATFNDEPFDSPDPDNLTRITEIVAHGTLTNSATVEVEVVPHSQILRAIQSFGMGGIDGMLVLYNGGTPQLQIGKAVVNGEILILTAATTTVSGDSLAANKQYYIYLYDNSGTVQMHREQRDSASDDPVWNQDQGYFEHPSDGASKRLIGWYPTANGSAAILDYTMVGKGRQRSIVLNSGDGYNNRVVNGTASDSAWTAYSFGKYCPPMAGKVWITHKIAGDDAEDGIVAFSAHDLGSGVTASQISHHWRAALARAGTTTYFGPSALPFDDTDGSGFGRAYYRTYQASGTIIAYIEVHGGEIFV